MQEAATCSGKDPAPSSPPENPSSRAGSVTLGSLQSPLGRPAVSDPGPGAHAQRHDAPPPGQFPGAATRPGSPRAAGGCGEGTRKRAALPSATSSSMAPFTCEKHHCKSLPPAEQPPPPAPVDTAGASGRADPPVPLFRPRRRPRALPPRADPTCHGRPGAGGCRVGGGRRRLPPRSCSSSTLTRLPPPAPGRDFFPLFKMAPNARRPAQ